MTTIDDRPTATNPYVGPNPIEYGQPIYGRDLEIPDLRDTLISHRIVLFYAPSGAGKSSLINAGLRPQLEERDFSVLPTIRVGNDVDAELGNRYILSTIQSLDEARPVGWSRPVKELAELGLDGYLAELDELDESGKDPCLVFDQFEELFTLDPTDQAAKREFLTELGRCLRDRSRWALITMREDYIAQLDPYLSLIPTRLATRFRLDRLGPDAAMAAAQRPALARGVDFTEQAAKGLVDNIRSVRVRRGDQITTEFGPHVEPVVLQVVCQRLWERRALAADDAITVDDIDELGDVDDALADFCDDQIARAAAASGATEVQIRDWVESELIGEQGFRTQALRGPGLAGDAMIRSLEDGHFLRSESRRGTNWYEIAHDRLTQPILNSNDRWREDHLGSLQARAREWDDRDRPDSLLLRDELLDDAQAWAEANDSEIQVLDRQFLEASDAERQRVLDARRRNRRDRRITVVALLAVVVAVFSGLFAILQWDRAVKAEKEANDLKESQTLSSVQEEELLTQKLAEQATVLTDVARVDAEAQVAEAEANPSDVEAEAARATADAQLRRAEADEAIAKAVAARSRAIATQAELAALESDQSTAALQERAVSEEEKAWELRVAAVKADRKATDAELTAEEFTDPTEAERERGARDNLEKSAADDEVVVSQNLLNFWVPQISSGKRGTPEGTDFQEIERAHQQLEEEFDPLLIFSSDYISYSDPTFWVSLVPEPFLTADEVLAWCEENNRGPEKCFAKFISDDLQVEATTRYQPAEEE